MNGSDPFGNSFRKLLFIMRLSVILILCCLFQVSASTYSQNTKLNIKLEDVSIKKLFADIKRQSEFTFVYNVDDIDKLGNISCDFTGSTVEEILNHYLKDSDMTYTVKDKVIIIVPNEKVERNSGNPVEQVQKKKTITGKVTDEKGEPLPGVSIIIKGTTVGITTDIDGNYSLEIPDNAEVLVFSFVGMKTQEVLIGEKTSIEVIMEEDAIGVDEVVVTALGITREKKALGYAVQEVQGEIFERSKELDLNNSLNGRVSGVFISQGRSNVGSSNSRIVIRGESSISGNNSPLYIVDGFPASFVNPNDIESMSVLKGPAATALYGSRAAAGVIVITTKTGKKAKGFAIEVNASVTIADPAVLPDYQTDYGQGIGGVYNSAVEDSWGPKFDGTSVEQIWGGNEWKAYPNNVKDFYNTGVTYNNNIALSGGDEKSDFRLSYTDVRQKGMIPNTEYKEHNIDLNTSRKLSDKFIVIANAKFRLGNIPNNSSYDPRTMPINVSNDALRDYWNDDTDSQIIWRTNTDNPYFSLYEDDISNVSQHVFGNISLSYDFTKSINLTVRSAARFTNGKDEYKRAFGHLGNSGGVDNKYGSYVFNKYTSSETNTDFLLSYDKDFEDFSVKVSGGGNSMSTVGEALNATNQQLLTPGSYTMANHRRYPIVGSYVGPKKMINSLYAFANLGYKDMAYLDLTARNDWSSALPKENNSYFYPSATLSTLMHNIIDLPKVISFWKLRANYAMVGNDTGAGKLQMYYYYTVGTDGQAGIAEASTYPELNLKPELTAAYEFGSEINFFKNRVKLDFTYYHAITKNQIWSVQLSDVSGYTNAIKNAGEVKNRGFEITFGGTPIKTNNFAWNSTLNWSSDRSYVLELDPENPDLKYTQRVATNTFTIDQVGERRGQIYSKTARRFKYDPEIHDPGLAKYNGQLYHDGAKDLPRVTDLKIIGNVNPDWIAGWENSFSYKNFTLNALIVGVYGNSFYAGFEKQMMRLGLDPITGGNRDAVLPEGVWDSPDGIRPFQPGDEIGAAEYYGDYLVDGEINDIWVKDGSYVKLKELSLTYNLPAKLLQNTFFSEAGFTLVGRNLYTMSDVKYVDPEIFTGSTPGISTETNGVPLPRTWALNINLKF